MVIELDKKKKKIEVDLDVDTEKDFLDDENEEQEIDDDIEDDAIDDDDDEDEEIDESEVNEEGMDETDGFSEDTTENTEEDAEDTEDDDSDGLGEEEIKLPKSSGKRIFIQKFAENVRNNMRDIIGVAPQVRIVPLNKRVYNDIYDIFVETMCEMLVAGYPVVLEQLGKLYVTKRKVFIPVDGSVAVKGVPRIEQHIVKALNFKRSPIIKKRIKGIIKGRYVGSLISTKFFADPEAKYENCCRLLKDKDKDPVYLRLLKERYEREINCSPEGVKNLYKRRNIKDINYRKEIDERYVD